MEVCLLCCKRCYKQRKGLLNCDLKKFFSYTSSILVLPLDFRKIKDIGKTEVCISCFGQVMAVISFIENILKANKSLKVANQTITSHSFANQIKRPATTFKDSNEVLAKIQKIDGIVVKKVMKVAKSEPLTFIKSEFEIPENLEDTYVNECDDSNLSQASDSDFGENLIEEYSSESDSSSRNRSNRNRTTGRFENQTKSSGPAKEIILSSAATYTCSKCHVSYSTYVELVTHMKFSTCFLDRLTCRVCSKIFPSRRKLNSHLTCHKPKETFLCEECSKIFSNEHSLKLHIESEHRMVINNEAIFTCSICNTKYDSLLNLSVHFKEHKIDKMQSERLCEDCGKTCSNLQAYRKHIQIHKKDEKSFKCTFCKKAYVREEKYKLHLQKHNK